MGFKGLFLWRVIGSIRNVLPSFVWSSILRLAPVALMLSILDVFGLVIVVPVIQIILDPETIGSNPYLNFLYIALQPPDETVFILVLLGSIVLFFVLKNIIVYWGSFRQSLIAYDVGARLTILQFERYLYQDFQRHIDDNSSVALRKIIEIPFNFINGIMLPVVLLVNEIIISAVIVAVICIINAQLFLSIILMVSPLLILYIKFHKKSLVQASEMRDSGHTQMFKEGKQSIEGFRELKVFDKFDFFIPKFANSVHRFSNAMGQVYHLNAFSPKIIEMLAVMGVFAIFGVGIILDYNLAKLATFLVAFSIASYRLIPSINKVILCYNNMKSSEFVFKHFDSELQHYAGAGVKGRETASGMRFEHELRVDRINFSFSGKDALLNGVNLTIRRGEIVGIIGKSGSGKSTFLNILLGLLKPLSGKISVDGVEVTDAMIRNWHATISFVPQDPLLIEGSIRENIAFGISAAEVDGSRLADSIVNSRLAEFIESLPEGLETNIGGKALKISGGQKQRIAIARALYHNGTILIFDEPTSSLDPETEQLLADSIRELAERSYTIIIVAHRMEVLKHCNKIFELRRGVVGEPLKFSDVL